MPSAFGYLQEWGGIYSNSGGGRFGSQMTLSPGSSLSESVASSTKAEKILLENFPEVKEVVSKIGTAEVPTDPMAIEDADIMIILKPKKNGSQPIIVKT